MLKLFKEKTESESAVQEIGMAKLFSAVFLSS
jgi:hypothetical protein